MNPNPSARPMEPRMPVTFDDLAKHEPRLAALGRMLTIVAENIRPDDPNWCANTFYAATLKPLILPLVGQHRGRAPENAPDLDDSGWGFLERPGTLQDAIVDGHRWTRPATTVAEETLRSAAAYDVVVRHLHDQLPPCRECGCVRVSEAA